ncbi:MAG: N-acetyl-gamma-glutamyl-phosphate reductase [Desulfobacterales bacterium]|nr:N-acetyl-gamma-glutamyl-phosphate reductase [Desulfobacterales bacterium]
MIKVAILGATGYTGYELLRLLSFHKKVEVTIITSNQHVGKRFDSVFPSAQGWCNLICEELSINKVCEQADFIFTALPHKIPMEIVPAFLEKGKKVIDLSADFRFKNSDLYEAFYQPHKSKHLLNKSVYGLSEISKNEIKNSELIGNPGCYPTSILLPIIPLIRKKIIDADTIIADSKSGVSGAGRGVALTSHFCEVNESFKAYKVGNHRHTPEICEILSYEAQKEINITFTPHLVPITRGMLSTIYTSLIKDISYEDIKKIYDEFYGESEFIRIRPENMPPDTLYVKGTNYCDIGFKIDNKKNKRLIIMSAIDNLLKGASGQAVQNMNIMLGFDETLGLKQMPFCL